MTIATGTEGALIGYCDGLLPGRVVDVHDVDLKAVSRRLALYAPYEERLALRHVLAFQAVVDDGGCSLRMDVSDTVAPRSVLSRYILVVD